MVGSLEYRWQDMDALHHPIEEAGAGVTTQGQGLVPAVAHALVAGHVLVAVLTHGHILAPDPEADLVLTARAHVDVLIHGLILNLTASLGQGPNEV